MLLLLLLRCCFSFLLLLRSRKFFLFFCFPFDHVCTGNYYSQRVVANESRCRTLEDVRNSPTIGGDPVEKLEPPPIKLE